MFTKTNKGTEGAGEPPLNPAQQAIRAASNKPAGRTAPSIISADMKINGSVQSDGEMQIDGTIDGDVQAASLTIGQSGKIIGEVRAETVVIRGRVEGAVRAKKVELETGADVHGDIVHASLSIHGDANFEGQVKRADDPLKQTGPVAASKPAASPVTPSVGTTTPTTPTTTTNSAFGKPS